MFGLTLSDRDLAAAQDAMIREGLGAMSQAVAEETRALEQDLEKITRLAVPGRLWRAWASVSWPKGGKAAIKPKGEVYVNGGHRSQGAMRFFTEEGRIRSKDGYWLAIPTPAAGSQGRGRTLTPGNWERTHGQRLEFVYRPGKPSLLIARGTKNQRTGSFRPVTAKRTQADRRRGIVRKERAIVIFVLVPYVNFKPSFSVQRVAERREKLLAGRISRLIRERKK